MKLRFKNKLVTLLAAGLLAVAGMVNAESPVMDRILEAGKLRVGMSGDQAPFNMVNRSGDMMGMEVDLAMMLAASMGVELEIITESFDGLLPALEKGKVDMVMSGMAITSQRVQKATFVGPYMLSGKSILTKDDVLAKIQDADAINNSQLKLAALSGSTSQQFIELNMPEAKLVKVKNYDKGVQMVRDGKVDAMVADMPICILSVMRYPNEGLMTLDQPISVEPIGIAVSPSDPQLQNLLDTYLFAYEQTGILNLLRSKWLDDDSWIASLP